MSAILCSDEMMLIQELVKASIWLVNGPGLKFVSVGCKFDMIIDSGLFSVDDTLSCDCNCNNMSSIFSLKASVVIFDAVRSNCKLLARTFLSSNLQIHETYAMFLGLL